MGSYLQEMAHRTHGEMSFFEAITATAIWAFSETPADIALIEVGMGGLWDGTNAVTTTCASVITPISMDHQEILGKTYGDIALQKSGIMRSNIPCISAPQSSDVATVMVQQAKRLGSPLLMAGEDWFFVPQDEGVLVHYAASDPSDSDFFTHVGLVGAHQRANAALAAMVLHTQRALCVPFSAIDQGFRSVFWPGRLQKMKSSVTGMTQLGLVAPWHEAWIDGAHNEGGARILADHIVTEGWNFGAGSNQPLIIVLGILPRKDPVSFWTLLAQMAHQVWVLESWGKEKGVSLNAMRCGLKEAAWSNNLYHGSDLTSAQCWAEKARHFPTLEALTEASLLLTKSRFLFCGSLYLVGEILKKEQQTDQKVD